MAIIIRHFDSLYKMLSNSRLAVFLDFLPLDFFAFAFRPFFLFTTLFTLFRLLVADRFFAEVFLFTFLCFFFLANRFFPLFLRLAPGDRFDAFFVPFLFFGGASLYLSLLRASVAIIPSILSKRLFLVVTFKEEGLLYSRLRWLDFPPTLLLDERNISHFLTK